MYIFGTTGDHKGALITEKGLIKNILGINENFEIQCGLLIKHLLYYSTVLTGEYLISLYKGLNCDFKWFI